MQAYASSARLRFNLKDVYTDIVILIMSIGVLSS